VIVVAASVDLPLQMNSGSKALSAVASAVGPVRENDRQHWFDRDAFWAAGDPVSNLGAATTAAPAGLTSLASQAKSLCDTSLRVIVSAWTSDSCPLALAWGRSNYLVPQPRAVRLPAGSRAWRGSDARAIRRRPSRWVTGHS
jgi:hypothetical protein